jgi:hypothetical protein
VNCNGHLVFHCAPNHLQLFKDPIHHHNSRQLIWCISAITEREGLIIAQNT